MACSTADRMEETWRLNWLFAFRGVKPWVLWRVFYLAQAVAGWGWLMVVCSPTSMDSDSGVDCWVFFGQCLFVFQAAFFRPRNSLSASFGVRYPRAE